MTLSPSILIMTVGPFVAALVGGIHCVGMCGAIATWAAQRNAIGYHLGRLIGYLALGLAGSWLIQYIPARVQLGVGLLLGIAIGGAGIRGLLGHRIAMPPPFSSWLTSKLSGVVRSIRSPAYQGGLIGISTAILPCGWLYSMIATAVASGSPTSAIVILISFWLGTIPPLWFGSYLWGSLGMHLGHRSRLIQSGILIILALVTIGAKLTPLIHPHHPTPQIKCVAFVSKPDPKTALETGSSSRIKN